MRLPDVRATVSVENLFVLAPARTRRSSCATFTLKTLLVGARPPAQGCVRLDGDDLRYYGPDQLGTALQDIELFSGCVRDNIARFRADAARCAGDRGGNTHLCARNDPAPPQRVYDQGREDGVGPSGGQRQRSVSRAPCLASRASSCSMSLIPIWTAMAIEHRSGPSKGCGETERLL